MRPSSKYKILHPAPRGEAIPVMTQQVRVIRAGGRFITIPLGHVNHGIVTVDGAHPENDERLEQIEEAGDGTLEHHIEFDVWNVTRMIRSDQLRLFIRNADLLRQSKEQILEHLEAVQLLPLTAWMVQHYDELTLEELGQFLHDERTPSWVRILWMTFMDLQPHLPYGTGREALKASRPGS